MRKAVVALAALAVFWNGDASAATYVLRSSTTGAIAAPVVVPPETPAVFALSMAGETSVAAGAALDLSPVVTGLPPRSPTYSLIGRLPHGTHFDPATGRIRGYVLVAGTYQVWISATDSTGATATAGITIVVT